VKTIIPIAIITTVLGAACAYMSLRSMALSPLLKDHPWLTWGTVVFCLLTVFLVPFLTRNGGHGTAILAWFSYTIFGLISTFIIYLAVADLAQYILGRVLEAPSPLTIRIIKECALWTAVVASIASVSVGCWQAMAPPKVRRVEVPILGLIKALDGFTIVQISDLHINSMTSKKGIEELTEQVNALEPNLVAITGDLVDGTVQDLLPKVEVLGNLRPKNCVCYVTGNHEYYSGEAMNWVEVFNQMHWCVLMNDNVLIQRNDAKLIVLGVPDTASKGDRGSGPKTNLNRALVEAPKGVPRILLNHKPKEFFETERAGIALQLSGHTHGGQYFPWSVLIPLFWDYPAGLKRYKRMWIYTSTGTGFWGPPNRFLRPKELTLLVLKKT